jgi:iron complex transport system substrate-binding protein
VRPLILLLLAATAVSVLGCQESGFDERKETARPLKVQHVLGETKVPGQAEEPLTLTVDSLDDTLALGVRPVRAAVPGLRLPGYLRGPAAGVELMEPVRERSDLPAVEAVHPDLILGSDSGQGRFFEGLSTIAPTVMTEGGSGQWKLNLRLVGEALGRTNDAEVLLSRYDRAVAAARRPVDPKTRVAVARQTEAGLRFAARDSFAATVLADAGVRQAGRPGSADLVLLAVAPGGSDARPAGIQGRVARVDLATWWGPGGISQAQAALKDLPGVFQR